MDIHTSSHLMPNNKHVLPSNNPSSATGTLAGAFSGPQLDHMLASAGKASRIGPVRFGVLGSGPFANEEITRALVSRGREAYFADVPVGALVVGRDGWQGELLAAVEAHRGMELRVYSQEMLLTLVLTREDPYSLGAERIAEMFGDHPALRYLAEQVHFNWPTLQVPEWDVMRAAEADTVPLELRENGILALNRYRVGYSAVGLAARRRALGRAFERPVPARAPDSLRGRIATAGTARRLQQVAESIAYQYRLASRRREADMRRALKHWRADLAWLKVRYYDALTTLPFRWPELPIDS